MDALPRKGTEGGSKVVIFSAWQDSLSLLYDELERRYDANAIASVGGSNSNVELNREIDKFRSDPRCFVLLLSVMKCATGLSLTFADHCFLVELQQHEGTELQLVNRINRVGQTRKVIVKKFLMRQTVEERILQRRAHAGGFFVDEADETDRIALPPPEDDDASGDDDASEADEVDKRQAGGVAEYHRFSVLRDLFGLSG